MFTRAVIVGLVFMFAFLARVSEAQIQVATCTVPGGYNGQTNSGEQQGIAAACSALSVTQDITLFGQTCPQKIGAGVMIAPNICFILQQGTWQCAGHVSQPNSGMVQASCSTSYTCPEGQTMQGGVCRPPSGGGCSAGSSVTGSVPVTSPSENITQVQRDGCVYELAEAENCMVGGQLSRCGRFVATGGSAEGINAPVVQDGSGTRTPAAGSTPDGTGGTPGGGTGGTGAGYNAADAANLLAISRATEATVDAVDAVRSVVAQVQAAVENAEGSSTEQLGTLRNSLLAVLNEVKAGQCGAPGQPPCAGAGDAAVLTAAQQAVNRLDQLLARPACGGVGQPACSVTMTNATSGGSTCGGAGQPPCVVTIDGGLPNTSPTCGGVGQPPCAVSDSALNVPDGAASQTAAKAAGDSALNALDARLDAVKASALPTFGDEQNRWRLNFNSVLGDVTPHCKLNVPWALKVGNQTVANLDIGPDICWVGEPVRGFLYFALGGTTLVYLLSLAYRRA